MSGQVKRNIEGRLLLIKVFKLAWKIIFLILNAILAIASEKRSKPRPVISAQILHDEGLISDEEYMRSVFPDK